MCFLVFFGFFCFVVIAMGMFLEEDTRNAGAALSSASLSSTTTGVGMISMRVHVSRKRKIRTNNFAKRGEIRSSTAVKRVPTSAIPPSMVRMVVVVVVAGWVASGVDGRAVRSFVLVLVLVLIFVAFVVVGGTSIFSDPSARSDINLSR